MNAQELLKTNKLVKHLAGSHAYGTSRPESDTDYRGIIYAPKQSVITPWNNVEQVVDTSEENTVYYELGKFMKLLVDQNPNIVETLWVDERHVVESDELYWWLRAHRHNLLSSKCAFTYSGYAMAQMKRIRGHNKWINNPMPAAAPKQWQFLKLVHNFTEEKTFKFEPHKWRRDHRLVPYGNDIYGVYFVWGHNLFARNGTFEGDSSVEAIGRPKFVVKFNREEYKLALEKHKQYWEWKNNRNEARSELEEQFGYDTKHAMHLVRLMRTAKEILTEEEVKVFRPDADELLAIRNGAWTYEELLSWTESIDKEIRDVHYKATKLPRSVDVDYAADVLLTAYETAWAK